MVFSLQSEDGPTDMGGIYGSSDKTSAIPLQSSSKTYDDVIGSGPLVVMEILPFQQCLPIGIALLPSSTHAHKGEFVVSNSLFISTMEKAVSLLVSGPMCTNV